jgi:ATP-dependent Lhr-like helicase
MVQGAFCRAQSSARARLRFAAPSPPQEQGWPSIAERKHTLILAPTGSGKTLAAFFMLN